MLCHVTKNSDIKFEIVFFVYSEDFFKNSFYRFFGFLLIIYNLTTQTTD